MSCDIRCPVCKGNGREHHESVRSDGEIVKKYIICELCKGTGVLPVDKSNITCSSKGYYEVYHGKSFLDYLFSELEEDEFY